MIGIKTDLTLAYERLELLNIETTSEQFQELGQIMYDLANSQFEKGLDSGERIFKKNRYE
jgi:hypothetical protein